MASWGRGSTPSGRGLEPLGRGLEPSGRRQVSSAPSAAAEPEFYLRSRNIFTESVALMISCYHRLEQVIVVIVTWRQADPGPAGGRTGMLWVLLVVVCNRDPHRFVLVKQRLSPLCGRAGGQHGAETIGCGHLRHVRQRHGGVGRQVRVRRLCCCRGGAARRFDPQGAEQELGRDRRRGARSRTVVIRIRQKSGSVRGPVELRREEEARTAGWDDEARDPLRSQNQRPQRRPGFNG